MRTTLTMCLSLLLAGISQADLIYDVDFEPPTYTNGAGIYEGTAPNMPPYSTDAPSIVAATGISGFSSQVAHFHNGQMGFYGETSVVTTGVHQMTFEMGILGFSGTVLFELERTGETSPTVGFSFYPTDIHFSVGSSNTNLSYTMGTPNDFRIWVDLDNNSASVWVDDSPVFENEPLSSDAGFYRAAFLANPANYPNDEWAVDNFQWSVIPEPSVLLLMVVGGIGFWLRRLRVR